MDQAKKKQDGFVLVVALILLAVMSLLAVNGMGLSTMGERMSGNYMERNRAQMAAEQALTQGQALLRANAVACLEAFCNNTNLLGTAAESSAQALPSVWSDANSVAVTVANGQLSSGKFLINALTHTDYAKVNCRAYSIMGRGVGLNLNSVVLLQTVAYICPTD